MIHITNGVFHLQSGTVSYILRVVDGKLYHCYWGKAISTPNNTVWGVTQPLPWTVQTELACHELPVYGMGDYASPAVEIELANGSRVLDFCYKAHNVLPQKPALEGLPSTYNDKENPCETLEILLVDEVAQVQALLRYTIFQNGAITRSVQLQNCGTQCVKIRRIYSASVDFYEDEFNLLHLPGTWAQERKMECVPLAHGIHKSSSCRGGSSHNANPFLALLRAQTTEYHGEVYAVNLIYSGNFAAVAERTPFGQTRLQIGVNEFDFGWVLAPNDKFQSPEAVLVYSAEGLSGMSHIFHLLYRKNVCSGKYRDAQRPILLNNWEATYFDFDEEKLLQLAQEAKDIGAEMLVVDDGWFGKRNDDTSSLGDWVVNTQKLPQGLKGLSEQIHAKGLQLGLWFEPEMCNENSDLYRAHPDWCLRTPHRACTPMRNQLVLDVSREDVQNYIIQAVSAILNSAQIDYVKWDMNRSMTEVFSALLAPQSQQETAHRYILGLYRVLEHITHAFPNVLFESCSGGGGRFDAGMLYYMPQIWTSDNTDAVDRMYIQYGTSRVYPVSTMGAHVSAVPNHQTGRSTPLTFRGNVAMCGCFGYEMDLSVATVQEKAMMQQQVAFYKKHRNTILFGKFYRLANPFTSNYAAWQVVAEKDSLVFVFKRNAAVGTLPKRIKLKGLCPEKVYVVRLGEEVVLQACGDFLMEHGLTLPEVNTDCESFVYQLSE